MKMAAIHWDGVFCEIFMLGTMISYCTPFLTLSLVTRTLFLDSVSFAKEKEKERILQDFSVVAPLSLSHFDQLLFNFIT